MTDPVNQEAPTNGIFQQMLEGTTIANPDQGQNASTGIPSLPPILGEIKNERGEPKYKSVDDALAALKASQDHIATIERENQSLRSVAQEAKTIDQLMAQLDSTKNNLGDNQSNFSLEDIKQLVSQTLQETEAQKSARQNQQSVVERLTESFGTKAEEQYALKAKELGLSVQELNALASRSPKAVLQYFSADMKGSPVKTTQGTVNTESTAFYTAKKAQPQTVMFGASTHEMVNAWRAAAGTTEN